MTLTPVTASLSGSLESLRKTWCVYEHRMQGSPPPLVYIGACLLRDLWTAPDARRNTAWVKLVTIDTPLLISVTHIGTISECLNARASAIATHRPVCNVTGRDISTTARLIRCSNGQTYRTQQEAAETLGISQSAISKVLRRVPHHVSVQGYTFSYDEEG
jgi:hypothetical protein